MSRLTSEMCRKICECDLIDLSPYLSTPLFQSPRWLRWRRGAEIKHRDRWRSNLRLSFDPRGRARTKRRKQNDGEVGCHGDRAPGAGRRSSTTGLALAARLCERAREIRPLWLEELGGRSGPIPTALQTRAGRRFLVSVRGLGPLKGKGPCGWSN